MEKKPKFINLIKSLKFRVFIMVAAAIIVPIIISNIVIMEVATNNYLSQKLNRFNTNNTLLKNSIISENYIEKKQISESTTQSTEGIEGVIVDVQSADSSTSAVNIQIEHMSSEYDCRVEIINTENVIIKDTDNSEEGKTSISENVIRCLKGDNIYIENIKSGYVEFAIPLTTSVINQDGKTKTTTVGAMYVNYSIKDVETYKDNLGRYILIIDLVLGIFAFAIAWVCCKAVVRPIARIEDAIEQIFNDNTDQVVDTDYSEIKKITNEFKLIADKFNAQAKTRQEFVSNVSHELKTPITSMKVLADSLLGQQGMPEELYQEFLQDISKETDRENEIITDLLELVKMEKSEAALNISSVNINEILESALKRLKPIAEMKNIELVFESFRPVIADVDEIKFASVVQNLVENAIKYNITDGTVTASLNSDHQYFYLKVTDTGMGISEEDQERVFERFFRVDKARARETGGTGLGLAISKEIVIKHHGSIKIHSKEGEGTTFTVRVPLKYIK